LNAFHALQECQKSKYIREDAVYVKNLNRGRDLLEMLKFLCIGEGAPVRAL
jgi:hypothetical protein